MAVCWLLAGFLRECRVYYRIPPHPHGPYPHGGRVSLRSLLLCSTWSAKPALLLRPVRQISSVSIGSRCISIAESRGYLGALRDPLTRNSLVPRLTPWLRSSEGRSGTRCNCLRLLHDPRIRFSLTPDRRHCARSGTSPSVTNRQLTTCKLLIIQNCQVWWLQLGGSFSLSSSRFTLLFSIPVLFVRSD